MHPVTCLDPRPPAAPAETLTLPSGAKYHSPSLQHQHKLARGCARLHAMYITRSSTRAPSRSFMPMHCTGIHGRILAPDYSQGKLREQPAACCAPVTNAVTMTSIFDPSPESDSESGRWPCMRNARVCCADLFTLPWRQREEVMPHLRTTSCRYTVYTSTFW